MPVITNIQEAEAEGSQARGILGNTVRPCLQTKRKENKQTNQAKDVHSGAFMHCPDTK